MSSTLHSATSSRRKGRDFWGVVFCVFSLHLQLKQPLKIPMKTSHTERQLLLFFFCSWRWWEHNAFMKLKIRADLRFYKGKEWDLRLGSVNCRAHPVSDIYTSERQKGKKIRFRHMQGKNCFAPSGKGFIGASGNKGMQWAWVSEPLQLQIHLDVDGLDPQLGEHWSHCERINRAYSGLLDMGLLGMGLRVRLYQLLHQPEKKVPFNFNQIRIGKFMYL